MEKVSREVAIADFERWLDFKRIKERKRDENKEQEETIVDFIIDGDIVIDDDCNIVFTLSFPVQNKEGEDVLTEMKFKPRLKVFELNARLKGEKSTDGDGRVVAYISALTDVNKGIIRRFQTEDYNLCSYIVMYFL